MLKVWQNSSNNTSLLIQHFLICGAEKIWTKATKLQYHGLLSGSTIEVKEMMARFTIDAIASCALGINSNTLKDPDSEFGRRMRKILDFTPQKGCVGVVAFFAPYLNYVFRVKFLDEETNNFVRQTVWNTVGHRWDKHFITYIFNETVLKGLPIQKLSSTTILDLTVPPSTYYSIVKGKGFNP